MNDIEYRLNRECAKCKKVRAVVFFDGTLQTLQHTEYTACLKCLQCGIRVGSDILEDERSFLENLKDTFPSSHDNKIRCRAEFHLWLLEDRAVKTSDLVHPNEYIRREAAGWMGESTEEV